MLSRLRPESLTFADAPDPRRSPSLVRLVGEVAIGVQAARLIAHRRRLRAAPRLNGAEPPVVIDIPGWFTPEVAMSPLRRYLASLGFQTQGWGLGHNTSDVLGKVRQFVPQVRELAAETGRPVSLVGWSLGGLVAREVAREAPDAVDRIVTIAAPAVGGPRWTNARHLYSPSVVEWFRQTADARNMFPISRPITSIVSRRDGVIHWHAQIDRTSTDVRHVEVESTHTGMAFDPDVWLATAEALASTAV